MTQDKESPQIGFMLFSGYPELITYELPDLNNQPHISCIPTGTYRCIQTFKRRTAGGSIIPRTFEVTAVPKRSGILIHSGNSSRSTSGCLLVGLGLSTLKPAIGISNSGLAFQKFMELTEGWTEFELKIRQA